MRSRRAYRDGVAAMATARSPRHPQRHARPLPLAAHVSRQEHAPTRPDGWFNQPLGLAEPAAEHRTAGHARRDSLADHRELEVRKGPVPRDPGRVARGTSSCCRVPIGTISAATVTITVPLLVLVVIFQKRIVAGLTAGALKG